MDYLINKRTQAIMNVDSGYYRAKICEQNRVVYSIYRPQKIIDYSCTKNGSSLVGRIDAVKHILGIRSKLPVPVMPFTGIYLFPTRSAKNKDCVWLSYYHIQKYQQVQNKVKILLQDKTSLLLNISMYQFDLQMKRTSQVIAYFYRLGFINF